jgi:hypothetical protein
LWIKFADGAYHGNALVCDRPALSLYVLVELLQQHLVELRHHQLFEVEKSEIGVSLHFSNQFIFEFNSYRHI